MATQLFNSFHQSAKGAKCKSLGQRPRNNMHPSSEALKARNSEADHFAPSAPGNSLLHLPGPLAQAFTFRAFGAGAISICLLVLAVASVADAHPYFASASFEQTHRAQHRARKKPLRKPDVIYYPTPPETVAEMLRMAEVKKGDVLYDLGSGDGRIPIAAAREFGIRAVGIEIDPKLVKEAEENARQAGVSDLVRFRNEDMFHIDVHEATIVTLYLSEKLNVLLRPKLLSELRPGSRILSHDFLMGDWKPEKTVRVPWGKLYRTVYLWTVPQKPARRTLRWQARLWSAVTCHRFCFAAA